MEGIESDTKLFESKVSQGTVLDSIFLIHKKDIYLNLSTDVKLRLFAKLN